MSPLRDSTIDDLIWPNLAELRYNSEDIPRHAEFKLIDYNFSKRLELSAALPELSLLTRLIPNARDQYDID
jgi:hypothetical protein